MSRPRNTELFEKIAKQIEDHPRSYDQRFWSAENPETGETCHCIAGWAVEIQARSDRKRPVAYVDTSRGYLGAGQDLLGLTEPEARTLFNAGWKPRDGTVPQALREIGAGAPIEGVSEPTRAAPVEEMIARVNETVAAAMRSGSLFFEGERIATGVELTAAKPQ